MNGAIPKARGRYDVVGASEGTDLGSINPDSASFLIRALADHLDKLTQTMAASSQGKNEQVEFDLDATNIPAGGFAMKLPTGSPIAGYYVENNSAQALTLFAGTSAAGRWMNTVAANYYKSSPVAQQVTSICIVAVGSSTGLVRVLLSTQNLGPGMGSTIGSAPTPPSTTGTSTTLAATTVGAPLLPANPARVGALFSVLAGGGTAYLGFGFIPTATNYSALVTVGAPYNLPVNFKGAVGVVASAPTTLAVTEFT